MFIHAAESGQKEAERIICCSCWQVLPKLDPEVHVPTMPLVGYQASSEEIRDLYWQVYMLKRLPGPPPCGPERAQKITKDIMFSLKDCLRKKEVEQPGGGGEPESASTHPLTLVTGLHGHEGGALQGSKNLLRPGKPTGRHWWLPLCWRNTSKDSTRWRQQMSTTRTWLNIHHCSQSWDWPRRRSWGWSCRHGRAPLREGHQSQSPSLSPNGSHWWVTFLDSGATLEEEQVLGQASTDFDLGPLPDLGPDLEYFLQELAVMQGEGDPSQGPPAEGYEDWIEWRGCRVNTPDWGAHPENKSHLWAHPSKEWSTRCWEQLFGTSSSQVYLMERLPTASKLDIPLSGYQGGAISKDFGLCTSPAVLVGEVQPTYAQLTMPFGGMHAGIEKGNGTIHGLLWWCCPGGCHPLVEVPGRMNWGSYSQEDPASPCWGSHQGGGPHRRAGPCQSSNWRSGPIEELTEEAPPTEEPTDETAAMEEPTKEPTAMKTPTSEPAGEPDIPPVWLEDKGKGEVPLVISLVGWRYCILPSQWPPTEKSLCLPVSCGKGIAARVWGEGEPDVREQKSADKLSKKDQVLNHHQGPLNLFPRLCHCWASRELWPAYWGNCPCQLLLKQPPK